MFWTMFGCGRRVAFLIVMPLTLLAARIWCVWRSPASEQVPAGSVEDHRAHILAYLFATLLPFYRSSLETWRDLIAIALALALIVFLFWYLRLHYVNFILAVFHYHIYTVYPAMTAIVSVAECRSC